MNDNEVVMLGVGILGIIVWIWAEVNDKTSQWHRWLHR